MQDRYAGDIGDFMKLGLIRALVAGDPPRRLGVNWYLCADESHNADGKHIGYLDPIGNLRTDVMDECSLQSAVIAALPPGKANGTRMDVACPTS